VNAAATVLVPAEVFVGVSVGHGTSIHSPHAAATTAATAVAAVVAEA